MDLGVVSLDGGSTGFGVSSSDPETRLNKWYGSGFLKQERSGSGTSEDEFRTYKVAKTEDFSASKPMLWRNSNSSLRSNGSALFSETHHHQPQMLSFSSPKSDSFLVDKLTQNAALPYYSRNTGYGSGSMHGGYSGLRGPFTASQWMELEHQALIYKYITANMPVPSHLLIPIKKALDSAGFCNFSSGLLRPNALGWGGFHLGFSNNTDPEPGRCRRTDGKKWRCSRDAVVDQKYCERHMNRGRHRSRKPVEGQSGHAVTGTTTTTTATTPNNNNNNNIAVTSSSLSVLVPGNSASNSLTFAHHDSSTANTINRMFMTNKETNASERMQENPFMIPKHQIPYDESSRNNNEFGLVTSDSLLNPSQKSPTSLRIADTQNSLRHFIDDCPKTELDMSFTSSPTNEKLTLSPLRLSKELDPSPIQMGLGVGTLGLESNPRQASWIPISWESSMGGPLGEVLNLSSGNNNGSDQCGKNSSALNLMTDGWDNSPPLGSSPTGVLQKTAFGSLFNSSAGSSPRAEGKTHEGGNVCNDLLAPTLV